MINSIFNFFFEKKENLENNDSENNDSENNDRNILEKFFFLIQEYPMISVFFVCAILMTYYIAAKWTMKKCIQFSKRFNPGGSNYPPPRGQPSYNMPYRQPPQMPPPPMPPPPMPLPPMPQPQMPPPPMPPRPQPPVKS